MRSVAELLLTLLLNAAWQIAVVTLFAGCCSWLLRETAAWCRHSVWVAALMISLCLPVISALKPVSSLPVTNQVFNRIELESRGVRTPEVDPVSRISTVETVPHSAPAAEKSSSSPISLNRNLVMVILALYGLLLLYRGTKLFQAWRRTSAIMRCTVSVQIPAGAAPIIAQCQRAIGVTHVRVVSSPSVLMPMTAGVLNPVIILPERLLNEADEEILLSAIGHELVHVARRDYILNLVYELIYLPLSFHPAAAVLRRRIKQTRELCCDELVARKILAPDIYARSLVRLIDSVPLAGRLASDTTIGITDADILEVRIMSLLKISKVSARRNSLLLLAACLLFAVPCAAAAAFALEFDIDNSETGITQKQDQDKEAARRLERAREELIVKERELEQRATKDAKPKAEELEALRRMEVELEEASGRLSREQETEHLRATEDGVRELHERLAQIMATQPTDEVRMREVKERLAELQRSLPADLERTRELRERLAMVEKQYPNAAQMAEQLGTLLHAQEELAIAQEAMTQEKREKIEEKMKLKERESLDSEKYREAVERAAIADHEKQYKIKSKVYEKLVRKDLDKQIRREMEVAGEYRAMEHSALAQMATMSMDRAIQVALSQHPGKVLSCNLGRQKDGQVYYRLVIITGGADKSAATHVWVSATDGRILKTEHE